MLTKRSGTQLEHQIRLFCFCPDLSQEQTCTERIFDVQQPSGGDGAVARALNGAKRTPELSCS
jgi:hypothetical protein